MPLGWVDVGVLLLVLVTLVLVIFVGFLLWRDGYGRGWRASRKAPPTCLRCGYNLSGLTQCRCPECGAEFRLEELWGMDIYNEDAYEPDGQSKGS